MKNEFLKKRIFKNGTRTIEITEIKIIAYFYSDTVYALIVNEELLDSKEVYIASFDDIRDYKEDQLEELLEYLHGFKKIEFDSIACIDEKYLIYSGQIEVEYMDVSEEQYRKGEHYKLDCCVRTFPKGYTIVNFYADKYNKKLKCIDINTFKYLNDDGEVRYVYIENMESELDIYKFVKPDYKNKLRIFAGGYTETYLNPSADESLDIYSLEYFDTYTIEEVLKLNFVEGIEYVFQDKYDLESDDLFEELPFECKTQMVMDYTWNDEIAGMEFYSTEEEAEQFKQKYISFWKEEKC